MVQVFDEQKLLRRLGRDLSFLAATIQMLETDGRAVRQTLQSALAAGDYPRAARMAQSLKGMIGNFDAPEVQALALAVERAARAGDGAAAAAAAERLERGLEMLVEELGAFVKGRA